MKSTQSQSRQLKPGDLAEVIAGPCAGVVGKVTDISIDDGVLVKIELQNGMVVWSDLEDVQRLAV